MAKVNSEKLVTGIIIGGITIGVTVIATAASIPSYILWGWALSWMWSWFIVPALQVPPISVPLAIGIWIVCQSLTDHHAKSSIYEEDDSLGKRTLKTAVALYISPLFTLLIAYIVHLYV